MSTPKRILPLCLSLLFFSSPAFAELPCYNDQISNTNGMTIRLMSGWVMKGYPGTGPTISFWQPLDNVKVCALGGAAYSITDTSQKNKTIKALRQH